jgi:hypothetical protein
MKTPEVRVPDDLASKIERAFEEKLARDAEFEDAASRVLSKNAGLDKRLS